MSVALVCNGNVSATAEGAPLCDVGWTTFQYESVIPFDVSQLIPSELGLAFGLGFMISVVPIAMAFGLKQLLSLIKI